MKTIVATFLLGASVALTGCQTTPPVFFFDANPSVHSYQESFNEPLTIVLGAGIADDFVVGNERRPVEVHQFRKSLRITLYYMFKDSFTEVQFADEVSPTGYTLRLSRLRPAYKVVSSSTSVVGTGDVVVSIPNTRVAASFQYDGVIYRQGQKKSILDDEVTSRRTTDDRKKRPEVFRDATREFCEVLYKEMLKTELQAKQ